MICYIDNRNGKDANDGPAPVGSAICSIIDPRAEAQIILAQNRYTKNDTLLVRFGGENYTDLADYKFVIGKDVGSTCLD